MEIELSYFNYKTFSFESVTFDELINMDSDIIKSVRVKIHTFKLTKNLTFEPEIMEFNLYVGTEIDVKSEIRNTYKRLVTTDIENSNLNYYYAHLCKLNKDRYEKGVFIDLTDMDGYMLPLQMYPINSESLCFNSAEDIFKYLDKLYKLLGVEKIKKTQKVIRQRID